MKKGIIVLLTVIMLLVISTGCTTQTEKTEDTSTGITNGTTEDQGSTAQVDFSITINGTAFTQEDAKDLEYMTKDVQKQSKDGEIKDATWSGYQVNALLKAAGVTDYESVTVAAADGFSAEITAEQAKLDTTLFGLSRADQTLESDEVPTLVVSGEGSKIWVKGIVSVSTK